MSGKNEIEFANFILRFGEETVLIDLVEEIVIPAFTEDLERSYKNAKHFFRNVEIVNIGSKEDPIICVIGRYIKDTIVKREQVFDKRSNKIIKNETSLPTAPSSVFILILNNHRLIYFNETAYAPSLSDFQRTVEKFVVEKYKNFTNEGNLVYPNGDTYPDLKIIHLTSEGSISKFIDQYSLLKTVKIELVTTNNELDNNDFFAELRRMKEETSSNTTTITHNNKDGLCKNEVAKQLELAIIQGNSNVQLKGIDNNGNKLEGSNKNLKVGYKLREIPQSILGIANKCYETFMQLVEEKTIRIGSTRDNTSEKIAKIARNINTTSKEIK